MTPTKKLTSEALARMIDHTCLKTDASVADIEKLCSEAVSYGFASVCVHPVQIARCAKLITDPKIKLNNWESLLLGR